MNLRTTSRSTSPAGGLAGFTLIEVLVSVAFIGITMVVFEILASSMRMNRDSRVALTVNQAVNSYLETVYADWQSALQYRDGSLSQPPALPRHTWDVSVATVNVHTGATSSSVTFNQGSGLGSYKGDVPLKRVTLRYTSASGGKYVGSVEVARP